MILNDFEHSLILKSDIFKLFFSIFKSRLISLFMKAFFFTLRASKANEGSNHPS